MDVLQLHLGMLGVDLLQRVLDSTDRARYIRLQQDIEIFDLPGLDLGVQIVKPDRLARAGHAFGLTLPGPLRGDLTADVDRADDLQNVAGLRYRVDAQYLYRHRRLGVAQALVASR